MLTIYKQDGTIRAQVEPTDDSYIYPKISDEEFAEVDFIRGDWIPFAEGDYVELFGKYYTLYKKPCPINKISTVNYDYKLKFESPRADMDNVNLTLFDNTTSLLTPAYNPQTTYSKGNVVSYHTLGS